MPAIRFPKTGENIARCYLATPSTPSHNAIFETGAHLIAFAAGVGYVKREKDKHFTPVEDRPQPVDLNIFKSQGLYEILQIIAVADSGSHEVVDREDEIRDIVEQYASAGFRHMQAMHDECDGAFFHRQLLHQLEAALPSNATTTVSR